jgi:TM2 domain-containing membrane protein YozV
VTSVLLSMLIPGAGHIYSGRPGPGVAWMATTLMGYACFFLPGLFIHGLCLVSAARGDRGTLL